MTLVRRALLSTTALLAAMCLSGVSQSWAQSRILAGTSDAAVRAYWTPSRLKNALPVELKAAEPGGSAVDGPSGGPETGAEGAPPTGKSTGLAAKFYDPDPESDSGEAPMATSSFGAHFTTSRVFPDAAVSTYPYLATGKLFFRNPVDGKNYVCSASVYRQRLVITAGHCVFNASSVVANRRYMTNFLFIPALNTGVGPTGSWTVRARLAAPAWRAGTGAVPNSQDVAIMETNDRLVGRVLRKISFFTGYYGYQSGSLSPNHLTVLGYPCNIDSCNRMQQTNAQIFNSGGNNTWRLGSAQRGGTSGGPWLRDFGVLGVGAPSPSSIGPNIVKSVTSYGPIATEPKYLGGSQLNSEFVTMHNTMCGLKAGNCSSP